MLTLSYPVGFTILLHRYVTLCPVAVEMKVLGCPASLERIHRREQ